MSDDAKYFYANAVQIAVTPFDVTLTFMRNGIPNGAVTTLVPTQTQGKVVDSSAIGMSPSHAKAMLPAIYNAIVEYEKSFGKLGLPPELQANFDKVFGKPADKS